MKSIKRFFGLLYSKPFRFEDCFRVCIIIVVGFCHLAVEFVSHITRMKDRLYIEIPKDYRDTFTRLSRGEPLRVNVTKVIGSEESSPLDDIVRQKIEKFTKKRSRTK